MPAVEHDIFVTYWEPEGSVVAHLVGATLTKRGFRVYTASAPDDGPASLESNAAIEQAADVVVVVTPAVVEACRRPSTPFARLLADAVAADRNVVPLFIPGADTASAAGIPGLDTYQAVQYAPHAVDESIAKVAHRLTSHATLDERSATRQTKWMAVSIVVLIVAIAAGYAWQVFVHRPVVIPPLPPITVSVAIVGQRAANGSWVPVPVQDGALINRGDQLRLTFTVNGDGHAYVLMQDPRGDVAVLFPLRGLKNGSRVRVGEMYDAPAEGRWLTVDQVGPAAVYVVASYDSIENLEGIVEEREGETAPQERQAALASTIGGLLDGRHAILGSAIRTRSGRLIVQSLAASSLKPPATASMTLGNGAAVTKPLATSAGLLSVMSEIRLHVVQ
ncbi:MAG: DUF4384 domain-containing protein [Bacteroidales bacterium]